MATMILGIDTGLATLGWALYDEGRNAFVDLGVSIAERDRDVKITLDRVQRCAAQARLIADKARGCGIVVIEAMSFPPHSSQAVPTSLSWGAILGVACSLSPQPVLLTVAPTRWQTEVLGRKAEYEEIAEAATTHLRTRHPSAFATLERIPQEHRNHAIDAAMMALCAGLRGDRCDELDDVETIMFGPPCPHGVKIGSAGCSQCRGAIPRKVVYDAKTRLLTVDGDVKHARPVDPGIDEKYRERARRGNRKSNKNRRVEV
jgi:hypothetical protein